MGKEINSYICNMKSYEVSFTVKLWENDKIIGIQKFNSRNQLEAYLKEQGSPKLRYQSNDRITFTLEA